MSNQASKSAPLEDGISVAASLQGEHAVLSGTGFDPYEPMIGQRT